MYTETGVWSDLMTGRTSKVKIVTTWLKDGKYRFEMFMVGADDKGAKSMEITYTKRGMMSSRVGGPRGRSRTRTLAVARN